MPIYIKTSDGFRSVISNFLKTSDGWRKIVSAYLKTADGWRSLFLSSVTPSVEYDASIAQSTNATTYLVTLTGTNYHWSNADTLSYKFEQSIDNEATWITLASGTATNPSSGSSNTYIYQLIDNLSDVTPNIQNLYRFVVTGTNTTYNTSFSSTNNITSVYGPENITITSPGKSYNSVDLDWTNTAAPNAQKYLIYYKLSTDTSYTFSKVIANTFTTVDLLSSSTEYNFKVVPITGVSNTYKGYRGNDSNVLTITTDAPAVPTQLTSPTITGTGQAFSSINGTSGTYQSGTYQSKTSYIGRTISSIPPTNGSTTGLGSAGSPPYNITQDDVTTPNYYFYYVDAVTANDGSTVYYYYSLAIEGIIGSPIIDNYNRSVASGLGTMTPDLNSFMNPKSYIYNLSANGSSWSVNGSVALNASAVSGTNPYTYPQQSVELGGKTDVTLATSFPSGPDGLGLVFWSTSGGSWWASTVNRTASTTNKYVYYTLSTVCDSATGTSTDNCRSETVITNVCTAGQGTINNNCGPAVPTCPENGIGDQVNKCRTRSVPTCPENSTGNSSVKCNTRSVSSCPQNNTGNSSVKCNTRIVQSCPDNGIGSTSSNCKTRTVQTCPANGSGSPGSYCNIRSVTSCPDNGSGSSGSNCKTRTVNSQTCPNNGNGSTSSNCKTRTVTTYTCPTGYSLIGTNCYQNAFPYAVTAATATNTTVYDSYVTTSTTVYDSSVSTNVYDYPSTATVYDNYQTNTYYDSTVSTTVYDSTVNTTVYDGTVDVYPGNVPTSTTVYYKYGCTIGPVTQYGGTLPPNCSNESSTVTVYNTDIRTLMADGSNVYVQNTENVLSNEEFPSTIGGISVTTSGNNISTTLYSNTSRSSSITTKTYTASNPNKVSGSGASYFGIIKTPPGSSGGTQFDDLNIS